jgi:2-polyprenyl-3-methyl-5-hydroxy-6-metoxy-1,4-benzoquinol methylase
MDWYAGFAREQMSYWPTTVLDIGCNDGSQLTKFKELGFDTYGVDPAENLYRISSQDHTVICGFWDEATADQLKRKFDIISSQNAFAHIPDPLAYLKLAKKYLNEHGRLFISTSQADMVLNGEFDTIYHEHISFYNAESMRRLAERAGLYLIDVVKTPIHGTSYIFILSHNHHNSRRMSNILEQERIAGLHDPATYTKWARGVKNTLAELKDKLDFYRATGYVLVGYGAAAKGMTLLNAADIRLDVVIDDNPLKQGLLCPGVDTPVVGPDYLDSLTATDRVVFVPLAWNFFKEIRDKILSRRLSANDRFVKYFPQVEVK